MRLGGWCRQTSLASLQAHTKLSTPTLGFVWLFEVLQTVAALFRLRAAHNGMTSFGISYQQELWTMAALGII